MGLKDDRDATTKSLYAVFRIPDEDYIVTVKLKVIYRWVEAEQDPFEHLKQLRASLKRMSNQRKVDMIYRMAEHEILLRNSRYAPSGARVPLKGSKYVSGWLPW